MHTMNDQNNTWNVAITLAEWCARNRNFPEHARRRAEVAIIDTVGCMIAGAADPSVSAAARMQPELVAGRAMSLKHATGVQAPFAGLVNACAAHALDYDDNFFPAITHASAILVPALFALGEEINATGLDIVNSYTVGIEVQALIGKLMNPNHYESGWHATSTIGTIGVAAACAHLLKLQSTQILHALSIAFSLSGGSKKQFGTMTKPLHAGFAAMHGIMAARLAAVGMQGETAFLQGRWSFEELYGGNPNGGPVEPVLFPEAPLAIDEYGLVAKLYPSCMSSHLGIDGLLALRSKVELQCIKQVDIFMPAFMVGNLRYDEPKNEMEARFSMNYCAAIALLDGPPKLEHFTTKAIERSEVKKILPLVRMHVREAQSASLLLPWGGDCITRITLKDGTVHDQHVVYPKGCNQNPLSATEQLEKFIDCASPTLGRKKTMELHNHLRRIEVVEQISEITRRIHG